MQDLDMDHEDFFERRDTYRPENGEAPFQPHELFFSQTDDRGVIKSGNFVFQRISHYAWDELIGAPHKIVRHEDMPKGVFWLLWETIKAGRPMGAFVKNATKDNLHYWVFAVVFPNAEGYLSVRFKPSAGKVQEIEALYASLKAEEDAGLSPEESAQKLLAHLEEQGYEDYDAFGCAALSEELIARKKLLERPLGESDGRFETMLAAADDLKKETTGLALAFEAIGTIPTNLRVIATRLEAAGGAISVLSQNYWSMSQEISGWFNSFVADPRSDFAKISNTINECWMLHNAAQLLTEAAVQFERERRALGPVDVGTEKAQLRVLAKNQENVAERGLKRISDEAERIAGAITVMRRYISGLSMTRVMCKIESARLPSGGESLSDIIEQLGAFQTTINEQLSRIENHSRSIQSYSQALLNGYTKAQNKSSAEVRTAAE